MSKSELKAQVIHCLQNKQLNPTQYQEALVLVNRAFTPGECYCWALRELMDKYSWKIGASTAALDREICYGTL